MEDDLKQSLLRQLQILELEVLLEVDRVCKKHNITYYLGEGTLLGAVRHNGFIPWDDDIDILMKREDYEKFIKIAPNELKQDYFLQNINSEKNFWVFFSKVRLLRPTEFNQLDIKDLTEHNGPYIDIFPIDYVPNKTSIQQLFIAKLVRAYRYMLFYKTRAIKKPKKKKRKILYYLSNFYTVKKLHERIYQLSTKFNHKTHKYMVNYCSYYNTTEQTIRADFYDDPVYVNFEGYKLPIPKNSDYILSSIYGDYMQLPPVEKRVIKHKFPTNLLTEKEFITKIEKPIKMKEDINISVIIPAYNCEKYILQCLDSLDNQTYPYHELIIINDGSTDNTDEIIKTYKKGKKNIKYISHENKKQGFCRNEGLKLASGNYIMFLDSDDFIEPRTFELCVEKIREENPDFVNFDWKKYIEEKDIYLFDKFNKKIDGKNILEDSDCELLLSEKFYYTVTRLYKKQFLIDNDIFYGEGYYYEDHVFFVKSTLKAQKVSLIHAPLYCYRFHDNATTKSNFDSDIHMKSYIRALNDTLNLEYPTESSRVYILNHVLSRFITIYNKKIEEKYKPNFINQFIDIMKEEKIVYHKQLSKKWTIILKERILEDRNINKLVKLIKEKRKKNYLKKIYKVIKNRKTYYYILQKKKKIYSNTMLFMGFDYKYSGNSKYLFEQIQEKYPNDKYYFVTNDKLVKNRIKPFSYKFYRYLARSKIVLFESWFLKKLNKREGQIWIQTWHATTVKKLLFDTAESLTMKKNFKQKINKYFEILNWDYLLVDNKNISKYFETAFMLEENQILPFGYPRVKYLVDNKNNLEKKEEIKEKFGLPKNKKIVLYAPTWRDYNVGIASYKLNYQYLLDLDKLKSYLGDDYVIVFKDHHFKTKTNNLDGCFINGTSFETQDMLLVSDYVISDYSSIVFDAMAIDIPILIYANDILKYEECRGVYKEVFNDLLSWATRDEKDAAKKIKKYSINDRYLRIKKKYCYDNSNYKLLEFINDKLNGGEKSE